jgi:RNA polymerase subunit RPABC4/transcription elongation factor Spt4
MKKACRDCGYELDVNARGCPRCARNVEAERMIERVIWLGLLLLVIIFWLFLKI